MKKIYTQEAGELLTAVGIIAGFYALMALIAFLA